MFTRQLKLPERSFFLFGPRGTGKTTWLQSELNGALWFNLLLTRELLGLMRNPDSFRQRVEALGKGSWIVVDEIQKMPALLDEIHSLMNEHGRKYRFALTGSSARKLKRAGTNLLAGRAINRRFFPLTGAEMGFDFETDDLLRFGCLPAVRSEASPEARIDILEAYVANYIREEIQQEALVKNLDSFARFLEIAGLANAQVTNIAAISRDAGAARPTVQGYFDVLVDTLIGMWLPAWRPRAKVKETKHPKFYFFDPGVVRGLLGRLREPLGRDERGPLFETLVFHELRAWVNVAGIGGDISYWRTPSGTEVDFIWKRGSQVVAIEVKAGERWREEDGWPLKELYQLKVSQKCYAVYGGNDHLRDGPIEILPLKIFMKELVAGKILP